MSINRQYPIGTMFEAIEGEVNFDESGKSNRRLPCDLDQRVTNLSIKELGLM